MIFFLHLTLSGVQKFVLYLMLKAFAFLFPYQIVLDSDDGLFGGFSRLDHEAEYFTAVSLSSKYYPKSAFLILLSPSNMK